MAWLRINPLIVTDLQSIKDYISVDNPDRAAEVIDGIYKRFEDILTFPYIGANLSGRVSFRTDLKYLVDGNYVILYKIVDDFVEVYRVIHIAQDLTRIFQNME